MNDDIPSRVATAFASLVDLLNVIADTGDSRLCREYSDQLLSKLESLKAEVNLIPDASALIRDTLFSRANRDDWNVIQPILPDFGFGINRIRAMGEIHAFLAEISANAGECPADNPLPWCFSLLPNRSILHFEETHVAINLAHLNPHFPSN